MKKNGLLAFVFAAFGLLCVYGSLSAAEPAGKDLFKDATLADFDYYLDEGAKKEDVFSLKDGVLTITGKPFGWLETKKDYKNFVLKAEFRYPEKEKAINSGLFLRINKRADHFLPRCIEVQLAPSGLGDLFGFRNMKMSGSQERSSSNDHHKLVGIFHGVKKYRNGASSDLSKWQKIEISCFEDAIAVKVNGKLVNVAVEAENIEGKIGFQSEGGLIEFKNVILKEEN
ncbi:MAG: DUF1080 domain-containing protein [Planctomycetia bacterium]|nr:DUF1080 domain-containing protein [Planctomycetia bacterium]